MSNLLQAFLSLSPGQPLLVGEVTSIANNIRYVTLPDGAVMAAKGAGEVGDNVFLRDGQIHGRAPSLSVVSVVL